MSIATWWYTSFSSSMIPFGVPIDNYRQVIGRFIMGFMDEKSDRRWTAVFF